MIGGKRRKMGFGSELHDGPDISYLFYCGGAIRHGVFEIHLHLVWTTKYRKPVLVGDVGHKTREI